MSFSNELMAALLIGAFIGVVILARLIAKQIEKVSSKRIGGFTYLVIGALAAYYLLDLLFTAESILTSSFFYFWLMLVVFGLYMFWRCWRRVSKHTHKAENAPRM